MTRRFAYPATVIQDEDGFWLVTFPDVPEAGTDDREKSVALAASVDALTVALEGYIADRRAIPQPTAPAPEQAIVSLPPLVAAKVALYEAMRGRGISNVDMARRLGVTETVVRRLLNPRHASRIDAVCAALAEVGLTAELVTRDAA